ncbi:MAG: hypothetical protein A2Y80_07835 [Deltaproteobacteria bacterium RBG_13_58_19]|nr:MAG: hypothetical protein A2Y80_07835 [Deltaproteobacteria bacterium RBG_13_58_19]
MKENMVKRLDLFASVVLTVVLVLAPFSWAQPGPGRGGGMHYGMMWDAKTVETVKGEVTSVDKYTPGRGGQSYGLRLTLKTDKETLSVILGPAWYIEQQHFAVAPRDQVEIKGSRIPIQGQAAIIAAEVKKGNQMLRLRNDNGIPLWAGPR